MLSVSNILKFCCLVMSERTRVCLQLFWTNLKLLCAVKRKVNFRVTDTDFFSLHGVFKTVQDDTPLPSSNNVSRDIKCL